MKRRITRLIQLSGGLLGLMAVSVCALPRERLLLTGATRTAFPLRDCVPVGIPMTPGYCWQSPANAFCFKLDRRGHVNGFSADVATGKQIPLTRLNALLAGTLECGWARCVTRTKPHRFFCQPYVEQVALSPDGKRLLWLKNWRSSPQWVVATLDGVETQHWDAHTSSARRIRAF